MACAWLRVPVESQESVVAPRVSEGGQPRHSLRKRPSLSEQVLGVGEMMMSYPGLCSGLGAFDGRHHEGVDHARDEAAHVLAPRTRTRHLRHRLCGGRSSRSHHDQRNDEGHYDNHVSPAAAAVVGGGRGEEMAAHAPVTWKRSEV